MSLVLGGPARFPHIFLIASVKELTRRDADMGMILLIPLHAYSSRLQVRRMESIGNDILDKLQVPLTHRK